MLHRTERRTLAHHAEARFKQRLIVSAAVVRDHHVKLLQVFRQCAQLAGLFSEIPHKKLPYTKSLRGNAADADEKRIGARTAGQSGGFGIQEAPFLGRHAADLPIRNRIQQIVRKIFQIHDAYAAVAALALIESCGFVMDAVLGGHFLAV